MRLYVALCFLGAVICVPSFAEQKIAIESGSGDHWSKGAHAGFVRYSNALTFPNYPQQEGFYELSLGAWNHKYPDSAVGLAVGTRERWGNLHLDGSAGVAAVEHKTHLSNTYQQFLLRVGAGYKVEQFDFGVYYTHYSNAKKIFDLEGKNVGYDFITFQVGYILK